MSRARIVSGVVVVILVVRCGAGGPSEAELRRSLAAQTSRAWEIDSFDTDDAQDVGVEGAPIVKARFDANLHARENTYEIARMEGPVALIKPALAKGERRTLFGSVTSVRYANRWQSKFEFASNAQAPSGRARSELGKRTVLLGSEEERRYRAELEAARLAAVTANRRVILSLIGTNRVFECEQILVSRKVFPCRFEFASVNEQTGDVIASNRWFSLKTGVLKPPNRVSGIFKEDVLQLTEQIRRSEAGKSFTMRYTLRLSPARDALVGEFVAPGGTGTMRFKL